MTLPSIFHPILARPAATPWRLVPFILFVALSAQSRISAQTTVDGPLRMEVITAYNFVVDSNVESPSSFSPSAAHLGVKICNTGATTLTNVAINIGRLVDPPTSSGTPGVFAPRTVTVSGAKGYSGTFALQMPGGAADAVRTIPSLAPGACVVQYFFVTYPLKDPAGNAVTGAAPDPLDDLWLNYDLWAKATEGATTRRVSKTNKVTMRSEISAMANKIWPNTTSKVPSKYLDAIEQSLGWRPDTTAPQAGSAAQMEGIWYDLGNVGAGFDNDGDGLPDRNAWMQPVGDPTAYNPLCMRLVKCYGIVVIKLNNGTEQLIPFEDRLYFENIPANNTGAVGLVFYEFVPLASGCTAALSPYQEVASGNDNEKFNGDYGAASGGFSTTPPSVNFNKNGPAFIAGGATATYTLTAQNTGSTGIGLPGLSLPFVFEDAIPASLAYVAGSATAANTIPVGNTVAVTWSTDNGLTWVATPPAPASVTRVRWTLGAALAPGTTAIVGFQATVPPTYPSVSVDNTGVIKLGPTGSLATSTVTSRLTGNNSLGDLVWKDTNRDGIKDAGEPGIPNITVSLYYDSNGNGALDSGEPLYGTTQTNGSGIYSFASLPDGRYIVEVDSSDPDLPAGATLPNAVGTRFAVNLDAARVVSTPVIFLNADWPFIDALVLTKTTTPTTYGAGAMVTYSIDLENHAAAVAPKTLPVRTSWASTVTGSRAAQNPANAQGEPDSSYARIDYQGNADTLTTSGGFTYASPIGTITKVELVINAYLSQLLTDDKLDVTVNGTLFSTLTTAQINTLIGTAKTFAVDVTSRNPTWSWAQVQALTAELKASKISSPDTGIVWVDSIGYRVTTVAVPAPTGTYGLATIDPLPLTDTFDPARLAYVSSSVPPTSVAAGTITWNNVGPLNPGARKTISVVFRARTTATAVNTTNTAASAGAVFVSGRPANSATSNIAITINPRGQIGDFIFWDLNNNGAFDLGEPGIPNVLVTLDNGAQTRTDATGFYIFRNLVDGTHTVTVNTPSLPWTSFTQTFDPDGAVKDNASTVTINNSNVTTVDDGYLDRDFGYRSTTNVISGVIFRDSNGNGVKDTGEIFLSGVTVTLTGTSGGTTTTDSSGYYSFGSLANGTYTVTVTQPSGTTQTLDPDVTVNNATTVAATGGNLYANRNFAYRLTGALSIGDTLYYDWNGNGTQDSGEGGIADIDVLLYRDLNGDGVIDGAEDPHVATVSTSAAGGYSFGSLPAGTYVVVVNTFDPQFPAGVLQIQDYDGVRDSMAVVNLTASLLTVDFGYKPQGTARIGDTVFIDTNGNGLKDASESGIVNVTVTLYADTNNNGVIDVGTDAVVGTATTGTGGTYLFTGLRAGNYLVNVDQNAASIPSDPFGNKYRRTSTVPHLVALGAGQTYLAADFGFAAPASIGDFVFFDSNGNGTQDASETGIPNVTVELYLDTNQDGLPDSPTPIATTVTATGAGANPAGFYQFTNLAAGTYFVKVRVSTLPLSGGQPIPQTSDPDRDGVPVNDNTYPGLPAGDHADSLVIVALGSNYAGADFGYQPPGALGDFVWLDLNQNGLQDSGEPGIANVTVRISNGTTTYNVATDFDGHWSVANISDGAWTVSIPASNFAPGGALENTVNTYDADGGTNSSAALVLTNGMVNLAAGNLGLDFGYALNGAFSISGTVLTHDTRVLGTSDDIDDFYDDGVDMDAGPDDETELPGIVVYLYTATGRLLGSSVTDASGNYTFAGLPAGTYRVIIGTTTQELQNSTLTTTDANHPAVSNVNASSGTTVIQTLTVSSANVTDVDFAFLSNVDYDYGDLPLIYAATTLSQDGARHVIPPGGSTLYLGTAPDADTNGVPTSLANGDDSIGSDDEDGITPVSPATWSNGTVGGGNGGSILASVTGSGWLVGWIDWNHDGDFLDSGELVVSQAVGTGSPTIAFGIPAGTIGATSTSWLSRFRVFTSQPAYPLFSYAGVATNGEVEDTLIEKPVGASIGDLVWNDTNGNGIFDSGELGLGGLTVQLRNVSNNVIATQITGNGTVDVDGDGVVDPAGYYRFRGLVAATYSVTVSTPPTGFAPSYDEDGTGTPHVASINLGSGEQHLSTDFGYAPLLANISGQVRYDTDGDGDLNDPDSGAAAVRIQLWTDPNGDGNPSDGVQVGETYTDADGHYIFTGVPTGNYVVVEINPAGTTSTADAQGANDDRIAVTLTGSNVTGRDFLDTPPPVYAVSGTVYADTGNDNVIGAGDTPLAAIIVRLYLDRNRDGVVNAGDSLLGSTVTNGSGNYSFSGLPAGDYVIQEIDPAGATSEWDAQGSPTDNQIAVTITNANLTGRDFLDDLPPGTLHSIGGYVYLDGTPDDNLFGAGDTPIGGVTVSLYRDLNGDGIAQPGELVGTTRTSTDGSYTFAGLPDGNYLVVETDPAGAASENDTQGAPNDNKIAVTLAGADRPGNNFLDDGITPATISGSVTDGTNPLPGVVLTLLDGTGNPLATTTTKADGTYGFPNLIDGSYTVVETNPAGTTGGSDVDGGDPDRIAVTVAGADVPGRNFIDLTPTRSAISGYVYLDGTPDDNLFGAGDAPIGGVAVSLYRDLNGDGSAQPGELVGTTRTSTNGSYTFPRLTNGAYLVIETDPAGATSENDTQGAPTDNKIAVTLAGTDSPGNNFLDDGISLHAIRGQVRDDLDADGVFSDPDRPLNGVTIRLFADANGNGMAEPEELVATTITDANGQYAFPNLIDGTYLVVETDLENSVSTGDTNNANDNLIEVSLAGADSENNDFLDEVDPAGYFYASVNGEIIPGGMVSVSGPGNINLMQDGTNGQYAFTVDAAGTYTIAVTPPSGWLIDATRPVAAPSYDVPPGPGTVILGSGETTPNYLGNPSAGANPYYLTFILEPGDQLVLNNNIPLVIDKPGTWADWQAAHTTALGAETGPAGNNDGDITDNLLEYALCLDPATGAPVLVADPSKRGGICVDASTGTLDAFFTRPLGGATDLTYTLEVSPALGNPTLWTDVTTGITPTITNNGDGSETVRYADLEILDGTTPEGVNLNAGIGFVRLRVDLDDGVTVATSHTEVFGWSVRSAQAECETCSYPFVPKEDFSGTIGGVSGAGNVVLDLATSAGVFSIAAQMAARPYYIEVLSGSYEGHRFDVASAGAASITLQVAAARNTLAPLPNLTGALITLRAHRVLDDVLPAASFVDTGTPANNNDPVTAGRSLFFDHATGWATYFAYDAAGTITPRWTSADNSFLRNVGDTVLTDGNDEIVVIDPARGFFAHPKAQGVDLLMVGIVREWDFAAPLVAGYNFVGSGYPLAQSPATRNMSLSYFTGSADPATADQIEFWMADGPVFGLMSYESHFRVLAGSYNYWTTQENSSLPNENGHLLFGIQRASFVRSVNGNNRALPANVWLWPLPWTP